MSSYLPAVITGLACYSFQTGVADCAAQVPSSSARALALGRATVALSGIDGVRENPAVLAGVDKAAALFGLNRLFGLSEITVRSALFSLPIGPGAMSGSLEGFGYEAYSVHQASVGIGAVLSSVSVGLRLRHVRQRFDRYGSTGSTAVDAGWFYPVSGAVSLGAAVTGLGGGQTRTGSLALRAGLSASISSRLQVFGAVVQAAGERADVRFGAETGLVEEISLRFGGSGLAGFMSVGAGLLLSRLRVDLAVCHHPRLGMSPAISVGLSK